MGRRPTLLSLVAGLILHQSSAAVAKKVSGSIHQTSNDLLFTFLDVRDNLLHLTETHSVWHRGIHILLNGG